MDELRIIQDLIIDCLKTFFQKETFLQLLVENFDFVLLEIQKTAPFTVTDSDSEKIREQQHLLESVEQKRKSLTTNCCSEVSQLEAKVQFISEQILKKQNEILSTIDQQWKDFEEKILTIKINSEQEIESHSKIEPQPIFEFSDSEKEQIRSIVRSKYQSQIDGLHNSKTRIIEMISQNQVEDYQLPEEEDVPEKEVDPSIYEEITSLKNQINFQIEKNHSLNHQMQAKMAKLEIHRQQIENDLERGFQVKKQELENSLANMRKRIEDFQAQLELTPMESFDELFAFFEAQLNQEMKEAESAFKEKMEATIAKLKGTLQSKQARLEQLKSEKAELIQKRETAFEKLDGTYGRKRQKAIMKHEKLVKLINDDLEKTVQQIELVSAEQAKFEKAIKELYKADKNRLDDQLAYEKAAYDSEVGKILTRPKMNIDISDVEIALNKQIKDREAILLKHEEELSSILEQQRRKAVEIEKEAIFERERTIHMGELDQLKQEENTLLAALNAEKSKRI